MLPEFLLLYDSLEVETHTARLENRVGRGENGDEEIEENDETHHEVDCQVDLTSDSLGLHGLKGEVAKTEGEEENDGASEGLEVRDVLEEDHAHAREEQQSQEEEHEEGEDVADHEGNSPYERPHEAVETEEKDHLEPDAPDQKSL